MKKLFTVLVMIIVAGAMVFASGASEKITLTFWDENAG